MKHSSVIIQTILILVIASGAWAANTTATTQPSTTTGQYGSAKNRTTTGSTKSTKSSASDNQKTTNSTDNKIEQVKKSSILDGALPELTQAEELQKAEELFQQKTSDLNTVLEDIGKRIEDLRRQTDRPMQEDLNRVNDDLALVENALNSIDITKLSPLTQLQRTELQDKIFEHKLSMEILNRRWSGEWDVFGLDFFQSAPPVASPDNKTVPDDYKIRKGDTLLVVAHSSLGSQDEYSRQVDGSGTILLPGAGRVSAAGRTAAQVEKVLAGRISSKFKQITVDVTVQAMSPMQVQVAGEAARPGTYVLEGMATVFNALYQAGGPKKSGSLRHISLIRSGCPTRNIDLYDFLLNGSKKSDVLLKDGDSIFIRPVGQTIVVGGEVVRPGRYEPTFPITLGKALEMAGGAKSGGYLQSVQVERVENGEYRALLSETIGGKSGNSSFALQPGDQVIVSTVRQDPTNQIAVTGLVGAPGMYGFREGMRISEVVKMAQGLAKDKEVYGGRADILRIEPFKGAEIISFDLNKALEGDEKNDIVLHKLDRVFVYSPEQVVFRPKLVTLDGCVARPGTYKRTGGMRVSDIVAAAGGVLPEAYLSRADLIRMEDGERTQLVRVDLQAALNGDPDANVELRDRDKLMIFAHEDVQWQDRTVRIEGAVQKPGEYTRSDDMRVSDLIFKAGGLLPEAGKTAEMARCSHSGSSSVSTIDLNAIASTTDSDPLLEDRDVVTIPAVNPYLRGPEVVFITGEVAKPGPYVLTSQDDKLLDVIKRAGGLTQHADTNGLLFLRQKATFEKDHRNKDSDVILEKAKLFADKQFLTQLAKMGVKLPEDFMLSNQENTDESATTQINEDLENTEQPGMFTGDQPIQSAEDILRVMKKENDKDRISAMGPPVEDDEYKNGGKGGKNLKDGNGSKPGFPEDGMNKLTTDDATLDLVDSTRISISLSNALNDSTAPDNMVMRDGDRIFIPRITNVVTVIGAVLHPHSFAAAADKNVDYYLERSGGYAQDAARGNVVVVRSNGDALPKNSVRGVMPGDTIVVPNTGIIDIAKRWERMGSVTSVLSDVFSTVYMLANL
ncbi:MAG: SLBB domain-containing protein [Armatimonadota bacterium]|nr:SLBB domain-containing protein [bacterium]